ncbi:MAG: hypothetical protein A2270_09135 [Elusimicrobia bacterium RIFOXYA12_FULL_51_18]|nr:MAG: hypothetical protein A2270_09135 [Elusimicrobia bacterium RIFOXYA12_FULL_51_18]OGS32248.1 MAG: hypothetical protein A2218_04020 [Elusimicrobia bacterium RIFOXYA2_FULL_53_38]
MKKISILFVFSVFQAAALAAQTGPAFSQLGAMSLAAKSDIGLMLPDASAVPRIKKILIIFDTQTGRSHAVTPVSGGFIYASNGQFVPAVYNGSGYILQTGQYWPIVGGQRGMRGVNPPAEGRWGAILKKTLAYGIFTEDDGEIPASRYLQDIAGPNDGSHKADYFSVWGYTNMEGAFFPDFVTMVSENWEVTPDGNWRIDQWLHWVGLDGVAQKATHAVITEAMKGQILDMQTETLAGGDPRAVENRNGLIEKWYLYSPVKR